jgi:hypothetical protein
LPDLEHEKTPDFKIDLVGDDMIFMPSTEKMFEKFTSEVQRTKGQQVEIEVVAKKSPGRVKRGHKRSMSNEASPKQGQKSMSTNQSNEKSWRV